LTDPNEHDEVTVVFDAKGAVKPEGTASVISAAEANANEKLVVSVYVKVKVFVVVLAVALVGDTTIVPVPSPVAAEATPTPTNGEAIAPIIKIGKRILTMRFIVIHQSMGSS